MTATETADATPEQQFAEALANFQAELPKIGKDKTATVNSQKGSYSYDYADLASISEAVLPLLTKHSLSWTARPTLTGEGQFVLKYALCHVSGHREDGVYPLPSPGNNTPQQIGSAITYARRYALTALTGVATSADDDDAQAARGTVSNGHSSNGQARQIQRGPDASGAPEPEPEWKPHPMAQALAELAVKQTEVEQLRTSVHEKAVQKQLLSAEIVHPDNRQVLPLQQLVEEVRAKLVGNQEMANG